MTQNSIAGGGRLKASRAGIHRPYRRSVLRQIHGRSRRRRHQGRTLSTFRYANSDAGVTGPAPMPGEHNHAVLAQDLGYAGARIEALETAVVLGVEPI